MQKLSDLFSYKEDNKELLGAKNNLNAGINKALKRDDANRDTLLIMKELLNSSCYSMDEYYKE